MALMWRFLLILLLPLALRAAPGKPLVMVIDQATDLPMALVQGQTVVGGMNHELGQLLGERLGRRVEFLAVPRKRVVETLQRGDGHFVCTYLPAWLPGPLRWSPPFFRQTYVVASRREAPAPKRLADLRGQRIGTVLGFVYEELESALGTGFVREDATNAAANLRKLAAGRLDHALVEGRLLSQELRRGQLTLNLHPPLEVSVLYTHCALGPKSPIGSVELGRAIATIQRDGSLKALYRRYD